MRASYFVRAGSLALLLAGCASAPVREVPQPPPKGFLERVRDLKVDVARQALPIRLPAGTAVDTVVVDTTGAVHVRFSATLSRMPFRDSTVRLLTSSIRRALGEEYRRVPLFVETQGRPIEALVPNFFRSDSVGVDLQRMPPPGEMRPLPVVRNVSAPFSPTRGLAGRNIVVWPSHGWYYSEERDRWEWQRPRLFQAVEDLIPLSFVLPYLTPMLERAGATVFLPRERDTQSHEVVVDNDTPRKDAHGAYTESSRKKGRRWRSSAGPAFAIGTPPYAAKVNPFQLGTARVTRSDTAGTTAASWVPEIPESGDYAVYVSYQASDSSVNDAAYSVYHAGGRTEFRVNQQIGGGTWQYLGTFRFRAGSHPESGRVTLSNRSSVPGKLVTADAVRFGGGMGSVERHGRTGGRPRFVEGSRYYLQYAGMPDTLVYDLSRGRNDYRDDYQSRPEYVNYLNGAPAGPNRNRSVQGLGIPVDLSLAFHTDAGITRGDTTVGTLAIYSVPDADGQATFPGGMSRLANRDLADMMQTQIVGDIRSMYDPAWSRRDLRDADYSEAVRPNVPGMLLELLSHQNFQDMKYVLDPRFRFIVSRAIYKGMLRFIATQHRLPAVVQPLPVTHVAATLTGEREITVRWKPALDPLEPTAVPERYILYSRLNDGGFDNGVLVDSTYAVRRGITPGTVYSFRVTAVNAGGESFPSETVAASRQERGEALIVNGFTRISGPATVDAQGFAGFLNLLDAGVPDGYTLNFTGTQYDFDPGSPFRSNDSPGHGASHADREGSIIAGNSFDFPVVHGNAMRACGYSFSSASLEAVTDSLVGLGGYRMVDLILGEQKETHWPKAAMDTLLGTRFKVLPASLRARLESFARTGGNLFVSGAYVASDLFLKPRPDSSEVRFAADVLKYTWVADHAAMTGTVEPCDTSLLLRSPFTFNTALRPDLYAVEAPDEVGPAGGSRTVFRYSENQFSAGVAFKGKYGVIVMGFPFETILSPRDRTAVMGSVLRFFGL